MAKQQTAAQKHTAAHLKRRTDRLENRPQPRFEPGTMCASSEAVVVADKNGDLIRIDPVNGTIRRLCWEQ